MNNARSGQEKLVQVEYVTNSGQNASIMKCVGVTGLEHERTQLKNMDKDICWRERGIQLGADKLERTCWPLYELILVLKGDKGNIG